MQNVMTGVSGQTGNAAETRLRAAPLTVGNNKGPRDLVGVEEEVTRGLEVLDDAPEEDIVRGQECAWLVSAPHGR